ncbi:MAG TPA: FGGY family carbohydrate kinase [Gaiellaceae bacterium]|jgi:xylulokinase|nr:FGGY family carbohydrate kinase [Gaiellaceae bacterium]HWJ43879.1 FGGY family carbohydrate kinase [Gaiellaceae bacterium]
MSGGDLVVGVDVGSQGACLSAFTADGERAGTTYRPYPVSYPRPGWAEQDPAAWVEALRRGFGDLDVDLARVAAISFASQLDGLVAVDEAGEPVAPAIIWMDRRADVLCDEVGISPEAWYRRSGCNLDGSHVAAKVAWHQRNRPPADRYLLPGAYLLRIAAGADVVDAANASSTMALDPRTLTWDEELLAAFEIDPARLPSVVACDEIVGEVTPHFAQQTGLVPGTVVVAGCGDEMGATLGAGVVEPGVVCDVLGTAEPVCAVTAAPLLDPTRVTECHPHAASRRWLLENPGWASGASYRWFRDELGGSDYDELNELAATVPPGSDGVVFVPWMGGAMAPTWDADARGGWYGLTPAHHRAHLCRSLLEGSAYALRDVIDAIRGSGLEVERIVCVAGGARSSLVRQLRADVTGVPVGWSEDVETTARGAAMLASVGAGFHDDTASAASAMSRPAQDAHEPNDEARAQLEDGYRRYRRLFESLSPAFADLAC